MKKLILLIIFLSASIFSQDKNNSVLELLFRADQFVEAGGNLYGLGNVPLYDASTPKVALSVLPAAPYVLGHTGAQVEAILDRVDSVTVALAFLNAVQDSLDDKLNRGEYTAFDSTTIYDSLTVKLNRGELDITPGLVQDSLDVKQNRSELGNAAYVDTNAVYVVTDSLASDIAAIGDSNFVLVSEMDLDAGLHQDSLDVKINRSELGTGAFATIANYAPLVDPSFTNILTAADTIKSTSGYFASGAANMFFGDAATYQFGDASINQSKIIVINKHSSNESGLRFSNSGSAYISYSAAEELTMSNQWGTGKGITFKTDDVGNIEQTRMRLDDGSVDIDSAFVVGTVNYGVDTSTITDTYKIVITDLGAILVGTEVIVDVKNGTGTPADNTGACTLTVNGESPASLVTQNGGAPVAAYIDTNSIFKAVWDGTNWVLTTPDANP